MNITSKGGNTVETYNKDVTGDTHELKTLPGFFMALICDIKTFEVRKKDRDYKINDILILKEWSKYKGYTGAVIERKISYILDNEDFCKEGFVILGIKRNI